MKLLILVILFLAGVAFASGRLDDLIGKGGEGDGPFAAATTAAPVPRIVVMSDVTDSGNVLRTPVLTWNDLSILVDVLQRYGGELLFGLIRDQSDRPLIRMRVDTPPVEPVQENCDSVVWTERSSCIERNTKTEATYQARLAEWRARTEREVQRFRQSVDQLLTTPRIGILTDLWGGVRRLDTALAESDRAFGAPSSRYAVLLTDGIDLNPAGRPVERLESSPMLVVVNGDGEVGELARFKPRVFEEPRAAFLDVVRRFEEEAAR